MKKPMLTLLFLPLVFFIAIVGFGIFEQSSLESKFKYYVKFTEEILIKTKDEAPVLDDITKLEEDWENDMLRFHYYIPHGDIRDIETLIAEAKGHIIVEEYHSAYSILSVVKTKFATIPRTFRPKLRNIL